MVQRTAPNEHVKGSFRPFKVSFEDIVEDNPTGQRLWAASGRAQGPNMSSYRAEAQGMLAAKVLIWMFIHYFCETEVKAQITFFCDNQSLVDETAWAREWKYANDSLKPEYDLLVAIRKESEDLRRMCPRYGENQWVKGHQEETTPLAELPMEAQLNVEADALASKEIRECKKKDRELEVIRNEACRVYVLSGGKPITNNEVETLRTKYNDLRLQDYYMERFAISKTTLDTVNWAARKAAWARLSAEERTYAIKQMIGWLPSGARPEKRGDPITTCHRCDGEETNNHVLQCPNNREEQRKSAQAFQTYLKTINTTIPIRDELVNGYFQFMTNSNTILQPRHDNCKIARRQQAHLGWDKLTRGMVVDEWACIQEHSSEKRDGRLHGDPWASKVSEWMIKESRRFWMQRNEERQKQSSTDEPDKPRELAVAEEMVVRLYDRKKDLPEFDPVRMNFAVPLERRLQLPLNLMQAWIKTTREMVNRAIADHEEKSKRNQPDIRQAFLPRTAEQCEKLREQQRAKRNKTKQPRQQVGEAAAELGEERRRREKKTMTETLMAGAHRARTKKTEKEESNRRTAEEAGQSRLVQPRKELAATLIAGSRANSRKEAAKKKKAIEKKAKPKMKRKRQKPGMQQERIQPHTRTAIDRIRRGRRPKEKEDAATLGSREEGVDSARLLFENPGLLDEIERSA
jgi:hypothetical protein